MPNISTDFVYRVLDIVKPCDGNWIPQASSILFLHMDEQQVPISNADLQAVVNYAGLAHLASKCLNDNPDDRTRQELRSRIRVELLSIELAGTKLSELWQKKLLRRAVGILHQHLG